MLMIDAVAGSGKTTTGMFGLGVKVPKGIRLSDEQKAVIKLMRTFDWNTCAAQAYNKSIATELQKRVPPGVTANTSNSFGHRVWGEYIQGSPKVDGFKTNKLFRELIGNDLPFRDRVRLETSVVALVNLCKNYVFDPRDTVPSNFLGSKEVLECVQISCKHGNFVTSEGKGCLPGVSRSESPLPGVYADGIGALHWLAYRFDIDISEEVVGWVLPLFTKSVETLEYIDFDDQNFLPVFYDVPVTKYDLVFVDELQDLNRAKQEMAFRLAKGPIVAVGDKRQAIYGFAGADSDSMENFFLKMGTAARLPMTITRRCPKSVVAEVTDIVPEFRAAPDASEGTVERLREGEAINGIYSGGSKMVLCRLNAPLTSLAFRLIAKGRRCFIQGRDLGSGLKTEVRKTGYSDLRQAVNKAINNLEAKMMDLRTRAFVDEAKIESLIDRRICIETIAENVETVDDYCVKVDSLFKDRSEGEDIRLSSCHRAKGLEHNHVVIYKPSKLPYAKLMKGFQAEQELNLTYVAKTRAMDTLTYAVEPEVLKSRGRSRKEVGI
jgi:hypothetical protein